MRSGTAPRAALFLLADQFFELWFVLGLAARPRLILNDTRGFGLAHTLSRVGLHRLRG